MQIKKSARLLKSYFDQRFGVKPLSESQADIARWFQHPLGQRILQAEQKTLDQIMPEICGYHLMQLSVLNHLALSHQSPVKHHFSLGLNGMSGSPVLANFEHLPIAEDSIDAVILHHVLEYSTNPHQLLREAARTIIPNGYIIIIGFNPTALLRLKKSWGQLFSNASYWRYHNLHRRRLEDWLRVLDFKSVYIRYGCHGLPFVRGYHSGFDQCMAHLLPFCGAYYVTVARKSVIPMTLIKQPLSKSRAFPNWASGTAVPRQPVLHRNNVNL